MPYTLPERRKLYADGIQHFETFHAKDSTAGDMNFLITSLCHAYIKKQGLNYCNLNTIVGVLECAKMEFYRMIAIPYENKKRIENGGISEIDAKTLEEIR